MKKPLLLLLLIIPFITNAQLEMDDFESYTVGDFDSQWDATQWVGWEGNPSGVEVSDEQAASGTKSIKVSENGGADDLVALLPVLNSGIHNLSFNQYIPAANGAYINLQHNYTNAGGDWAFNVLFSDASASEGVIDGGGEIVTFPIVHDAWASLLFVLNFAAEEGQFFYNDELISTWVLSTDPEGVEAANVINAINFFATCNDDPGNCTSLAYYDDILLEEGVLPEFSASLESEVLANEYFNTPLSQAQPLSFSATVANLGANNLNNISVVATVFDGDDNEVYSESLGAMATLTSGESVTLDSPANTFTATEVGTYRVEYTATLDEIDVITDSNTSNESFNITESTYTRDDGVFFNGFGSQGDPGIYGHLYKIVNTAEIGGIMVTHASDGVGETVQGRIMALSNAGSPTTVIAMTDVLTIPEAGSLGNEATITTVFPTPVVLEPGNYAFMIEQLGTVNLAVSLAENIFTPNTSFLTIDNGVSWDALEDISAAFEGSLAIHPVFGEVEVGIEALDFAPNIELTPNVTADKTMLSLELESTQDLLVEIYNLQGKRVYVQSLNNVSGTVQHELDLSKQAAGMYFVTISSDGKRTSKKLSLMK